MLKSVLLLLIHLGNST